MGSGRKVCVWFLANCEVQLCSTLAALSILGVVVVCPIMLDPAIDTLVSSFEKGMCQTVYSQSLTGLSNCTWTSCREGCTADIFSCWHIIVVYLKGTQEDFETFNKRANDERIQQIKQETSTITTINVSTKSAINISFERTIKPQTHAKYGDESSDTNHKRKWIIPPDHDYNVYEYNNSFIRNMDSNLQLMMNQIHQNLELDNLNVESSKFINVTELRMILGIGALLPNPQGCVYPSEIHCSEFRSLYGRAGGDAFPCFLSKANKTIVVTRVDTAGAVRNILYSFLPLIAASGIFTYLFYRVGLIGRKRRRRRKGTGDEESGGESDGGTPQKTDSKVANGVPPVVKKKLRKKFLPKRDSSKKRRKGKIFNKNKLLTLKTQLSVKSPSSSRRTPSMSMSMGDSVSDVGYGGISTTTAYVNNNRNNSVNLL